MDPAHTSFESFARVPPLDRLHDPDAYALAWYGRAPVRLFAAIDLVAAGEAAQASAAFAGLPGVASGHLAAFSRGLLAGGAGGDGDLVVGGPCIGDCTSFPTVEALYDAVQVLVLARALGAPALLYIGDREEMMAAGGEGRWPRVAERIAGWLERVAEVVEAPGLTLVRTSGAAHESALASAGSPAREAEPALLDSAFHVSAEVPAVQPQAAREVTRRVAEAHLPEVAGANAGAGGPPWPRVVIAENLQQAGVHRLAASMAAARGGCVEMAAHWPAPGLSSTGRMYRSPVWDKVPAWGLEKLAQGDLPEIHPRTRQFYASWLTPELRHELALASRGGW